MGAIRAIGLDEIRQIFRVMVGLLGDAGEQGALLFRLIDADRLAVHQQEAIAGAGFERGFAQRDTASGGRIELPVILNHPAVR